MASKKKFYISPTVKVSTDEYTNTLVGSVEGGGGKLGKVRGSIEKTVVKDNPGFNIPKKMNIEYQMGRYWEQTKRWFIRTLWPFKTKSGQETEVSKVRACCQSSKDDRLTEEECRCKEKS
jgi:hypothetical protein